MGTPGRHGGPDGGDRRGRDVQQHRRVKPWLHYESLRGTTYPSDGQGPSWRDLTHNEAQRMQEMYMRKRMLQRKLLWLKNEDLPNPQKDAKMAMRRRKDQEAATAESNDMYPVPFFDVLPNSEKLKKMDEKARMIEMESRFRNRIREEKLKNAKLLKSRAPHIGEVITDPIERHVQKRLVRQRSKMFIGLEQIMTMVSAQILWEFMRGVAISIVRIRAKRPRQTQEIVYNLTSDHDPVWVERQLQILAPKIRSQLALKCNMGQTPDLRFVPHTQGQEMRRKNLWRHVVQIRNEVRTG